MIDLQKGQLVVECDGCDDVLETGKREFSGALAFLKEEKWVSRQNKAGAWEHFCPRCK